MGRRNLTADQLSYYRWVKLSIAHERKRVYAKGFKSRGNYEIPTSARLSKYFNVNESTVKRDAKYAVVINPKNCH